MPSYRPCSLQCWVGLMNKAWAQVSKLGTASGLDLWALEWTSGFSNLPPASDQIGPGNMGKLHQPRESGFFLSFPEREKWAIRSWAWPKKQGIQYHLFIPLPPAPTLSQLERGASVRNAVLQRRNTGQIFKEKNILTVYFYFSIYPQILKSILNILKSKTNIFNCSHFYVSFYLWSKRAIRISVLGSVKKSLKKFATVSKLFAFTLCSPALLLMSLGLTLLNKLFSWIIWNSWYFTVSDFFKLQFYMGQHNGSCCLFFPWKLQTSWIKERWEMVCSVQRTMPPTGHCCSGLQPEVFTLACLHL